MIEETARVVAVEGDIAWVETHRQTACGSCAANKGCGTTTLAKVLGNRMVRLRALNTAQAKVGDEVVVGLEEGMLLRGSLAVYVAPLLLMLFLGALAESVARNLQLDGADGVALLAGALGFGLGMLWVRRYSRRISDDARYQPVILRRVLAISVIAARGQPLVTNKEIV